MGVYSKLCNRIITAPAGTYTPMISKRNRKITVHVTASTGTAQAVIDYWQKTGKQASANYIIDDTTGIVGYVSELDRAWTSGSYVNDSQAITIECVNSVAAEPYPISEFVMNKLLDLLTDICQRYEIPYLYFDGTPECNYTWHCMFQATGCPDTYMKQKTPEIIKEVNARINAMYITDEEYKALIERIEDLENQADPRFKTYNNVPKYFKNAVKKMIDNGSLQGEGGKNINLNYIECRIITWLDRMGLIK